MDSLEDKINKPGSKRSSSPDASGSLSPTKRPKLNFHRENLLTNEDNAAVAHEDLYTSIHNGHAMSPGSQASGDTIQDLSLNEPDSLEMGFSSDGQNDTNVITDALMMGGLDKENSNLTTTEGIMAESTSSWPGNSSAEDLLDRTYSKNGYNSTAEAFKNKSYSSSSIMLVHNQETFSGVGNEGLNKTSSIIQDAKTILSIFADVDYRIINKLLIDHRDQEDRLNLIASKLSDPNNLPTFQAESDMDIFDEVQLLIAEHPNADANVVYNILESLPPSASRIEKAMTQLKNELNNNNTLIETRAPLASSNSSISIEDSILAEDPLFRDMRRISKMFPGRDQNEIYALLEAYYNKMDRVQLVVNEILILENKATQKSDLSTSENMTENNTIPIVEDPVVEEFERLKMIFPDCDPNYIYERLSAMTESNRANILVTEMFEKKNYPKLRDLIEEDIAKQRKQKAKNLNLTAEEFLQIFPKPVETFSNITKNVSDLYKTHADILLKNEFPMVKASYIYSVLRKHNSHLYPAYREIAATVLNTPIQQRYDHKKSQMKHKRYKILMPAVIDEYFYHELWFTRNEQKVVDYPKEKELKRRQKVEEAKLNGQIYECCCCFDDECLFEELASCPEGHLFCKTCVIRSTESAFGEMKVVFPCLAGGCDQNISLNTLQTILPSNLFSKIIRRIQEEEVQKANIPDLVTCPFCPFATIMPNPEDKVLKCLNPECLKESCRLCQEPNHIPLRCNEVEKKAETDMRTYIENQISEAVMRKCHRCGKKFIKEAGCNKMTCICGATSCYACKAKDIDYDHFRGPQCANTNPEAIHQKDIQETIVKAKAQYIKDHPEAANLELKKDFNEMIKKPKKPKRRSRYNFHFQQHPFVFNNVRVFLADRPAVQYDDSSSEEEDFTDDDIFTDEDFSDEDERY